MTDGKEENDRLPQRRHWIEEDAQGLDRVVVLVDRVDHRAPHGSAVHHAEPDEGGERLLHGP